MNISVVSTLIRINGIGTKEPSPPQAVSQSRLYAGSDGMKPASIYCKCLPKVEEHKGGNFLKLFKTSLLLYFSRQKLINILTV